MFSCHSEFEWVFKNSSLTPNQSVTQNSKPNDTKNLLRAPHSSFFYLCLCKECFFLLENWGGTMLSKIHFFWKNFLSSQNNDIIKLSFEFHFVISKFGMQNLNPIKIWIARSDLRKIDLCFKPLFNVSPSSKFGPLWPALFKTNNAVAQVKIEA